MTAGPARIALLRAVNVGGRKLVMSELKAMAAGLGLAEPRTLMQSGNLVFRSGDEPAALEDRFERATASRFDLVTDYLVRDMAEWEAMIAANPFVAEARDDPSHLVVMSMKSSVDEAAAERLRAAIRGREVFAVHGRSVFLVYPDGIGESKLTIQVIERSLGLRGTGRNWNTVNKLAVLARG